MPEGSGVVGEPWKMLQGVRIGEWDYRGSGERDWGKKETEAEKREERAPLRL